MDRDVCGDVPLDYCILYKILIQMNLEILDIYTSQQRRCWLVTTGAYFSLYPLY